MSARLLRFFGAHPQGDWLKDVEGRVFRAHVAALPKLRAEEQIAGIQAGHAFVERPMEGRARSKFMADLERLQKGEREKPVRLGRMDLTKLVHMGIQVRVQGRKEAEEE